MSRGAMARKRRSQRRLRARAEAQGGGTALGLTAGATGSTDLPLSGRMDAWDAGAAQKSLDPGDFKQAHFWYDSSKPADQITSYKLPFAKKVDGKLVAVWRGVTAGAARLSGTQIPAADKTGVQGKMASYYSAAAKKYDDPSIQVPWKPNAAADAVVFADGPTPKMACADCGHMAMAHGGDSNMGACSMNGCDCDGFAMKGESAVELTAFTVPWETAANGYVMLTGGNFEVGGEGSWAFTNTPSASDSATLTFVLDPDFAKKGEPVIKGPGRLPRAPKEKPGQMHPAAVKPEEDDEDENDYATDVEVTLPDDHKPGQRTPKKNPTPKAPVPSPLNPNMALRWQAQLAPEGKATDDGRVFAPGSITWRELPLTLMAMTTTADGHDGAQVAGRIDRIWRAGGFIMAEGEFDSGDYGQEIARLVNDGTLRGVSVDIAPQKVDMAYRSEVVDADGNWKEDAPAASEDSDGPSPLDLLFGGDTDDPIIYVVREAVLGMATVCPFQAFADATITPASSLIAAASDMVWTVTWDSAMRITAKQLTAAATDAIIIAVDDDGDLQVITASAAGMVAEAPPLEWFDAPELGELTALTVDDDGRVYGHAAAWGTCHIGIPDVCTTAPHSLTNYSYYHLKEIQTDDGATVNVGTITLDTGHAAQSLGRAAAAAHYDDTGTAVADVVCGEDEFGIWVAGALRPDADVVAVRKLRGAALSGDWRNVNGNLELVALLAVNVPGFPIPRPRAELTASAAGLEVTALVAAGVHQGLEGLTAVQRQQWDALRVVANDEWAKLQLVALGDE